MLSVVVNLRYLDISLRLVTFDATQTHPAHIRQLVHTHLTVLHLTHIIRAETNIAASHVFIYCDRAPDAEPLPEEQSLEQCGFVGGPRCLPTPLLLYYDYSVDVGSGCPIVMCDHYFGQRKARVHRSQSALSLLGGADSPPPTSPRVMSAASSLLSVRGNQAAPFSSRQTGAGHITAGSMM